MFFGQAACSTRDRLVPAMCRRAPWPDWEQSAQLLCKRRL